MLTHDACGQRVSRPQPLQSSCAHIQAATRAGSYGHVVVEPVAELVVELVVELAAAVREPARVDDPSVGYKGALAVKGLPSPTAGGGGPFFDQLAFLRMLF